MNDDHEEKLKKNVFLDFTNWAYYRKDGGKYTPDDIDIDLCTHIVYGFAVLDKNTFQMIAHDSYVDEDKGKRTVSIRKMVKEI